MTNLVISLGSSCDIANQLKRIGINNIHYFFDFIWNEYDGLKTVTKIIKNNFSYFSNIHNYTKTTTHPILNWDTFNINKYYPNFVFLHHDTTKPEIVESLLRKIERTKRVLSNKDKKIFIYYRRYGHWRNPVYDLNIIINESLEFCEMYKNKYNDNFYLLSLIDYNIEIDIEKINSDISILKKYENKNIKFDFSYTRDDTNKKLNNISIKRWDDIFKKYKIKS